MKLIIAGGRDYHFTPADIAALDALLPEVTEVVSGCASGADREGEEWAASHKIPIRKFPADWRNDGRAAGPIRNRLMAEYADAVILFPGGKGTMNMHDEAHMRGLRIIDRRQDGTTY